LALEGDLAQHQPAFAPDDFLAMAQQSGEPLSTISTASLRDLRLTDEGFRFILSLGPGFTLTGKDLLGLDNLAPGEYVVILSEGRFSVQPFTSARVTLELELDTREDSLNTVRAALANEGLADLKLVQLSFVQICAGHSQEFGGQVTDLYGGESQTVSVRLPLAEGEDCTVEARVLDGVGTILKVNRIEIPPGDAADQARRLLQTSAGGGFPGFPFLLLGSLTALVGMLAAAFLRKGAR
jgi:hypothetical protein